MTKTSTRPLAALHREWFLAKLDVLTQDIPAATRKGMRRELRADLDEAADDVGMARAVHDLGPAPLLARRLIEAEGRPLPHWWTGVITFTVLLYAWAATIFATVNALSAAATQLGHGGNARAAAEWLGTSVEVTVGDRLGAQVSPSFVTLLVLVLVPAIAARCWRYRPFWVPRRAASAAGSDSPDGMPTGTTLR